MPERLSNPVQATAEYIQAEKERADRWVAACGGTEAPFAHNGEWYLYVWNPAREEHGYLHLGTDRVISEAPWDDFDRKRNYRGPECMFDHPELFS